MKRILAAAALAVATAAAAAAEPQQQTVPNTFRRQPREAAPALKATQGKQFNAGFVFIDGKYIKPPYKVERYGTVLRVNGMQVTNPVIAWDEFVKTQEGVKVSKKEIAAPAGPEPDVGGDDSFDMDDLSSDLDDLFSDEPAKPKKSAPRRALRPRGPTIVVTYELEGPFVPNDRTKALVDRINGARGKIDGKLRSGWYFFFGSRYSALSGDSRVATDLLYGLSQAMKSSETYEQFAEALKRNPDTSMLPQPLVEDLFAHKSDHFAIERRIKSAKSERDVQNMINRATR
ncbi:MAG: hypothetical protein J6U17_00780 [Kiritimatiellae bacterium]|nr:hypothetical protein [Kiritimatiellia bacterium]